MKDNKFTSKFKAIRDEAKVYNNSVPVPLVTEETVNKNLVELRNIRDLNKMIAKEYNNIVDIYIKRAEIAGESLSLSSIPEPIRRAVLPIGQLTLSPKEYISVITLLLDESTKAGFEKANEIGTGQINAPLELFTSQLPTPPSNMYKAAVYLGEIAETNSNNGPMYSLVGAGSEDNPPGNDNPEAVNEKAGPWKDEVREDTDFEKAVDECLPCFREGLSSVGRSWDTFFGNVGESVMDTRLDNYFQLSKIQALESLRRLFKSKIGVVSGMSFSRHLCNIQSLIDNRRCLPELAIMIASVRAMIKQLIGVLSKIAKIGVPSLDISASLSAGLDLTMKAFVKVLLDRVMQLMFTISNLIQCTISSINDEARKATEGYNAVIDGWNDTGAPASEFLGLSDDASVDHKIVGATTVRTDSKGKIIDIETQKYMQLDNYSLIMVSTLIEYRQVAEKFADSITETVEGWMPKDGIAIPVDLYVTDLLTEGKYKYNQVDILDLIRFYGSFLYLLGEIYTYAFNDEPVDKNVCSVAAYIDQPWIDIIVGGAIDDLLGGGDDDGDGTGGGGGSNNDPQEGDVKVCTCKSGANSVKTFHNGEWGKCECGDEGEGCECENGIHVDKDCRGNCAVPVDITIDDDFITGPVDEGLTNGFIDDILELDTTNIIDKDLVNLYKTNMASLKKVTVNNQTAYYVGDVTPAKCVPNIDGLKSIFDIKDWSKG